MPPKRTTKKSTEQQVEETPKKSSRGRKVVASVSSKKEEVLQEVKKVTKDDSDDSDKSDSEKSEQDKSDSNKNNQEKSESEEDIQPEPVVKKEKVIQKEEPKSQQNDFDYDTTRNITTPLNKVDNKTLIQRLIVMGFDQKDPNMFGLGQKLYRRVCLGQTGYEREHNREHNREYHGREQKRTYPSRRPHTSSMHREREQEDGNNSDFTPDPRFASRGGFSRGGFSRGGFQRGGFARRDMRNYEENKGEHEESQRDGNTSFRGRGGRGFHQNGQSRGRFVSSRGRSNYSERPRRFEKEEPEE
jgi:hypothetical protein